MSKVAKATVALMIVTMLSKVLGFIRETVLVGVYGASMTADVYITAMNIPTVIFTSIGVALGTTFIPLFFEVKKNKGERESLKFANNVFNIVIILSISIAIIGFIFAEPLIKIFAMDFDGEKLLLASNFTRIMIFGMVFIGLSRIMTCWLNINENFTIPGMVSVPYNIIIIISILLSAGNNVYIMAIGTLIATASQFIFQYPFARKQGFKYKLYVKPNDEYIKKMLILILPVFIGVGVNQLNTVVDRSLASTLGDGMITVLNSANRLNTFVQGLFIATIVSVIYPMLSRLSIEGNGYEFSNTIRKIINTVIILIVPISVGAIVLAEPVVRIVFERGKFDATATALTASALAAYSVGMIGFALREILNKAFYSLKDTKTPMVNGSLSMGINIILNIVLIKYLGHIGLALATSISALICIVLLFISLRKKIGYFEQDKILQTLVKSIISATIMGIATYYIYDYLNDILNSGIIHQIVILGGAICVGFLVYSILILLLKVEEVDMIVDMAKSKLKIKR